MARFRSQCVRLLLVLVTATAAGAMLTSGTMAADQAKKPADDYELYQFLADTIDQVERNYVKDISRRELMEAAIQGVLGKLDPYSNYIKPEEIEQFKSNVESQFAGIGIRPEVPRAGRLVIVSPIAGSPAYRAGLEAGDVIVEIDGKGTESIRNPDDAVKVLRGDAGSQVTLTVQRGPRAERKTVTLTREWIHVDTVMGDQHKDDDSWDFMLDHEKHIGYLRLTAFSRDTTQELQKALKELDRDGVKGLILDLRFNPGGLLSTAIEVCDLFIPEGRIVSTKGRNTPERVWDAHKGGPFEELPMAVLVNGSSASASEILSACLQDHQRAKVIGQRTWGKGSVQNVIDLEGGKSALKLTTASYHRPSGKNIHRFPGASESEEWGVLPDPGFEVKLNRDQTAQLQIYRRDRDIIRAKESRTTLASSAPAGDSTGDEPKTDDSKTDDTTKAAVPDDHPQPLKAEEPGEKSAVIDARASVRREFVDLQLQKAIEYLSQEAEKAPSQ